MYLNAVKYPATGTCAQFLDQRQDPKEILPPLKRKGRSGALTVILHSCVTAVV